MAMIRPLHLRKKSIRDCEFKFSAVESARHCLLISKTEEHTRE
jgi:hypothetical protein